MSWKPKNETHAIERMAIGINFRQPIPYKFIEEITGDLANNHKDQEFDSVGPIDNVKTTFELLPETKVVEEHKNKVGIVFKRTKESTKVVEELGFCDKLFYYTTQSYVRWSSTKTRLQSILFPVVIDAAKVYEIENLRLEYWNNFVFNGNPQNADVSKLFCDFGTIVPKT